ncbi:hypothetical protein Isop_2204 [Isosphaera pallida ATCC 43644]|uniref:Uncharacterized protein n=1 Tax=Isosphaera pallida (strain ATCC 43644 / DSM 9630 / IS1B) TaxID=575540 RepID=E8R525_ISOPI|nr:hypothetical protein Isop_2204 [Isosphaera pallida ATCC 43644]
MIEMSKLSQKRWSHRVHSVTKIEAYDSASHEMNGTDAGQSVGWVAATFPTGRRAEWFRVWRWDHHVQL